jgi:hypothetical protein
MLKQHKKSIIIMSFKYYLNLLVYVCCYVFRYSINIMRKLHNIAHTNKNAKALNKQAKKNN